MLLTASETTDATANARLTIVVLAEVLWIGQHCLEELQGNNLDNCLAAAVCFGCFVLHFVDTTHADVLNYIKVSEVLLTECHPETRALDGRIIDDERLYLLVMEQITLFGTDAGIGQRLMNLHRLRLDVLAILPVETLLRNLSDVDFGVEVRGKSLVMVACVAVHDVEILNLIKVMFGCVSCEDARHAWVETATQNGAEPSLLKAFAICPLPRVLEVCFVFGLVVSRIEIVATRRQTSLHDGEVLIRQREVHHDVGFIVAQQLDELLHTVGIDLRSLDLRAIFLVKNFSQGDTFLLRTAGNHHFLECVRILAHLMSGNGSYAASSDNQYSSHSYVIC